MAEWWIGISGSGMSSLLLCFFPPPLLSLSFYFPFLSTFSLPSLLLSSLLPLPLSCPLLSFLPFFLSLPLPLAFLFPSLSFASLLPTLLLFSSLFFSASLSCSSLLLSPALPLFYFFLLTSVLCTDILPLLILCTSFLHLLVYRTCQLITF